MLPAILNLSVDFYKIEEKDEAFKIAPIFLVPLLIILVLYFLFKIIHNFKKHYINPNKLSDYFHFSGVLGFWGAFP